MSSPFGDLYTALITVPEQGTDVELIDGNWTVTGGSEAVYKAYLKPGSPSRQAREGLDSTVTRLSGYLVDPMFFPDWVKLPFKFPITITTANGTQQGIFEVLPLISLDLVSQVVGQKLDGYLRLEDGD